MVLLGAVACAPKGVPANHDPRLDLPAVPLQHLQSNDEARSQVSIFLAICCGIALIYCIKDWFDTGKPVLSFLMLGGLLAIVNEPLLNVVAAVWYQRSDQFMVLQLLGRPMPLWVTLLYMGGYGICGIWAYQCIKRGITRKKLFVLWILIACIDIVLETVFTSIPGLYVYYGHQPLRLMQFPLWWPPINALVVVMSSSIAYLLTPHLRGWRWCVAPIIVPISQMMSYGATAVPGCIAVNGDLSWIVVQLLGVCTYALAVLMVYWISQFVASDSRYELRRIVGAAS
jgi:hypothetical protein